jgi:hypothetical protein
MNVDDYCYLLSTIDDCDVETLHAAMWDRDIDALSIIAARYEVVA